MAENDRSDVYWDDLYEPKDVELTKEQKERIEKELKEEGVKE